MNNYFASGFWAGFIVWQVAYTADKIAVGDKFCAAIGALATVCSGINSYIAYKDILNKKKNHTEGDK